MSFTRKFLLHGIFVILWKIAGVCGHLHPLHMSNLVWYAVPICQSFSIDDFFFFLWYPFLWKRLVEVLMEEWGQQRFFLKHLEVRQSVEWTVFFFVGTKMKAERNTFPSHIKFLSNWRWKLTLFQFLTLCSHHYVSCNVMYPWCFICCMKQLRISVLHIKVFFFLCFSLYSRSD